MPSKTGAHLHLIRDGKCAWCHKPADKLKPQHECAETSVYSRQGFGRAHACRTPASVFEDEKWWCAKHSPSAVKARQARASVKFKDRLKESRAPRLLARLRSGIDDLVATCDDNIVKLLADSAQRDTIDTFPVYVDFGTLVALVKCAEEGRTA